MSKKSYAINSVIFVAILAVSIFYISGISRVVDYVVGVDSERLALNWVNFMQESMPELDVLIASGNPSEKQLTQIRTAAQVGNVFRFKLFDEVGRNVLISDELSKTLEPGARTDHNGNAARVLASGESIISLNDGTQKENRPPVYVEAYVPTKNAAGETIGVVEVYLDQTAIYGLFYKAFSILAFGLGVMFVIAFGAPYVAFVIKNRQESRSRKRAEYLAHFDQLTKLFNRHGLMAQLNSKSSDAGFDLHDFGVIFLDVDHFKIINDSHGHSAGDAFLQHLGESISKNLKQGDLAGRFGGDEFVIILQRKNLGEIETFIKSISSAASSPLQYEGTTIIGNISVGVHYDADNDDTAGISFETRMQKADIALYQAKSDGRNTACTFSEDLETKLKRRKFVEMEILAGLEKDQFEIYFQPAVDRRTKKCAGFEALARLKSAQGEIISAAEFMPIAESMGKISEVGNWVLRHAIEAASRWSQPFSVGVNISFQQLEDNTLVPLLKKLLDDTGYDPACIELEVTESQLIDGTPQTLSQLDDIRELGVSLTIDNLGTGYSGLGHIWQFKFDKLKIDRSFVTEVKAENQRVLDVLDSIVTLAHRLGMTVTAGGVETEEQVELLSQLSCDYLQGYLYSKPLPHNEVAAYLLRNFSSGAADNAVTRAQKKSG